MKREYWVDNAKSIACFLVVFGHLLQSLVKSEILNVSVIYSWFNTTIYYFHVPVFFIASGYLYQHSLKSESHLKNCFSKIVNLGIPYVVFSTITYLLKYVMGNSINTKLDTNLLTCLLVDPISPYWFLYILLVCFIFFGVIKSNKQLKIYTVLILIFIVIRITGYSFGIVIVDKFIIYSVYFFLGMLISYYNFSIKHRYNWLFILFIPISFWSYKIGIPILGLTMSLLGIGFVFYLSGLKYTYVGRKMSEYFMPIYLLHTLSASFIRIILLKVGVTNSVIHIILGIIFSFIIPVIIAYITSKIVIFDFFFYPEKTIKKMRLTGGTKPK